ncbi:MAG: MBOAT family O-acyltransferase [Eubacteriales bacterium]|nr:MBOAT family O-acyltransferase [Eubacteriales bacterium]
MVFSSISFLFVFLPAFLLCYFIIPQRFRGARNLILLAFSLFFYAYSGVRFLLLMLVSIVLNYCCGLLVDAKNSPQIRKAGMILAVVGGLGLLGWFKYAGFAAENLNLLGIHVAIPDIVLPIGISFFTFQGLSYVIDVYRNDAPVQRNPFSVALYISMFPQLVAGPIVRYTTVAEEIDTRKESLSEFSAGATRFVFGLAKKILLADTIAIIADNIFSQSTDTMAVSLAWLGGLAFIAQDYFDFSAYSDMAIGLGRMMGFHFLENFNYPFISKSVTEFWRRWHISLCSWFRDYVYFPLGGSRRGVPRQIFNMLVVWFLTGLWHGASWVYIFWGMYYGILLIGEKYVWGKQWERLPAVVRILLTIGIYTLGCALFRSPTLSSALHFWGAMFGSSGILYDHQTIYYLLEYAPEIIIAVLASLPFKIWIGDALEKKNTGWSRALLNYGPPVLAIVLLFLSYTQLVTTSFHPFIYFQF